jgi:hypothetical protein
MPGSRPVASLAVAVVTLPVRVHGWRARAPSGGRGDTLHDPRRAMADLGLRLTATRLHRFGRRFVFGLRLRLDWRRHMLRWFHGFLGGIHLSSPLWDVRVVSVSMPQSVVSRRCRCEHPAGVDMPVERQVPDVWLIEALAVPSGWGRPSRRGIGIETTLLKWRNACAGDTTH